MDTLNLQQNILTVLCYKRKKQTMAIVAFNYNCFYKVCPDPSCHFEQEEKDVKNLTSILMYFLIYQTVTTEAVLFHLLLGYFKHIY